MRYNGGGNSLLGNILLDFFGVSMNHIRTFKSYLRASDFLQEMLSFPLCFKRI